MLKKIIGIILACLLTAGSAVAAGKTVGLVKTLNGQASIEREGQILSVSAGTPLYQGDTIKTGDDGSLGFILRDNTVMSLGPASELVITKFMFTPTEDRLSLIVRMLKGTATFFTGMIGKLSPESVKIETPEATIGIRGTRFALSVT